MVAMLSVAVSVLLLAPSAARGEETRLVFVSSEHHDRTFALVAEAPEGDGPLAAIHVDFYRGNFFKKRRSLNIRSFRATGVTKRSNGIEMLSVKTDSRFDPATGGRLAIRYLQDPWSETWVTVELDLLKREGAWILADTDGQEVDYLYRGEVAISDHPSGVERVAADPVESREQLTRSRLTTNIQVGRHPAAWPTDHIAIDLIEDLKEGEAGVIHFRFNAVWNNETDPEGAFTVDELFSSDHRFRPQYYGAKPRVIVFRPIGVFNWQRGGRIIVAYSNNKRFRRNVPNRALVLSLARGEDGRWVLKDETGQPIKAMWIKMNESTGPSRIMDVSEGRSWRSAKRLDRPIKGCSRALLAAAGLL